jgi:hypothetical protein
MTSTRRLLVAVFTCLLVGAGLLTAATTTATAARTQVTLNSVGTRTVGTKIPIVGYLSGSGFRHDKTLYLQRKVSGQWRAVTKLTRRSDGRFRFPSQTVRKAQVARWRVVAKRAGRTLDVSPTLAVVVRTAMPENIVENQTIEEDPYCQQLTVPVLNQRRTTTWKWNATRRTWVKSVGPWVTLTRDARPATAEECLDIIASVPTNAVLPDLRMKNLDRCGAGDLARTNGTCFLIENVEGHKLLKFAGLTFNVGAGASEIIADRTAAQAEDWKGYQTFYDARGNRLGSVHTPAAQFYYAGDGHNHWHVRDFDSYEILDATGTTLAHGEKHGYCLQDNTSYGPMVGQPGVPGGDGVYLESTSCGKGLPSALTIVHGLSRGWGDTYPTTLPDQAIDITGLADGTYTVRVTADIAGAVVESNDANNTASMQVTITGDTVTTDPTTATGGLN